MGKIWLMCKHQGLSLGLQHLHKKKLGMAIYICDPSVGEEGPWNLLNSHLVSHLSARVYERPCFKQYGER